MKDRLIHFLNTQLLSVVKKETTNLDKMCLYNFDGYWYAFEHSAYSLQKLFPKAVDKIIINHREHPFPIINVGVHEDVFKTYLHRHIAYRHREDYLEFKVNPHDDKEYYNWYKNEVAG